MVVTDYKRFTELGVKVSESYVTITRTPTLQFSAGFIHKYAEIFEKMTHVILGYSKDGHYFGIEFVDDPNKKGAIKITGKKRTKSVSIRSFLSFHFLYVDDVRGRYEPVLKYVDEVKKEMFICYFPDANKLEAN